MCVRRGVCVQCVVYLQGTGPGTVLPEADLKKYEAEFDEYGHKLDKAREE